MVGLAPIKLRDDWTLTKAQEWELMSVGYAK